MTKTCLWLSVVPTAAAAAASTSSLLKEKNARTDANILCSPYKLYTCIERRQTWQGAGWLRRFGCVCVCASEKPTSAILWRPRFRSQMVVAVRRDARGMLSDRVRAHTKRHGLEWATTTTGARAAMFVFVFAAEIMLRVGLCVCCTWKVRLGYGPPEYAYNCPVNSLFIYVMYSAARILTNPPHYYTDK